MVKGAVRVGVELPLKRVSTVRKYDEIGMMIMPNVKASSFMMTEL